MKRLMLFIAVSISTILSAQNVLTPETLWKLGRVSALGLTKDKQSVIYAIATPDVKENKSNRKYYSIPVTGGNATEINNADSLLVNDKISSDGKYVISSAAVLIKKVKGSDLYSDLPKSNVYVYTSLNYRHWDTWEDGKFDHVYLSSLANGKVGESKDLMPDEAFDCPQKPFGGSEDYIWNPDRSIRI